MSVTKSLRALRRIRGAPCSVHPATVALSFLLVAATVAGQSDPLSPPVLTLSDAVEIALQENPRYQAAVRNGEVAAADVELARSAFLPQVGAEAQYRRFETHIFFPSSLSQIVPASVIGPEDDWLAGLTLSWNVYDGGNRRGRLQAAKSGLTAARSATDARRSDTVLDVHRSYFALLGSLEAADVARHSVERRREQLRVAEKRKEAGAVPQLDVLRARSGLADAELLLITAEADVGIARGELNTAMGRPVETRWQLPHEVKALVAPPADADSLIDRAVRARAEVSAERARVEAGDGLVAAAESGRRPKAFVRGRFGVRDSAFLPEDPDWSLGAGLSYSIFDGGATAARIHRSRAERAAELEHLREVEAAVGQQVWTAFARAVESWKSIDAARVAVDEAEEALRLARLRYDAGAGTITDVIDAETALASADGRLVRTRYAYRVARSNLDRAVGDL